MKIMSNRVALRIIMMVGTSQVITVKYHLKNNKHNSSCWLSPSSLIEDLVHQARLMLGFMFTTMFLSMWISNTATTAMMLPIVDAVAEAINDEHAEKQQMAPLAEEEEEGEGVR